MPRYPKLFQTVLDTEDARGLAEFYRQLLGLAYRPGDEPDADRGDRDWLVLVDTSGGRALAFQQVVSLQRATWPTSAVLMQLHLDMTVHDVEELHKQGRRAEDLGAQVLLDRSTHPNEPLYVLDDPAEHPVCVFVH